VSVCVGCKGGLVEVGNGVDEGGGVGATGGGGDSFLLQAQASSSKLTISKIQRCFVIYLSPRFGDSVMGNCSKGSLALAPGQVCQIPALSLDLTIQAEQILY
jgi:hypothetical protein